VARKSLKELIQESNEAIFAPCVYDCASARAVEMVGFKAMMFSSGELSLAMNGIIDNGFTSLPELEWAVSRICDFSNIPLAVDIEDGFGGPLTVYRTVKRIARAGAAAVQLEDSSSMEAETDLLPREAYFAKVRAALKALEGTDCMLIARTNADPKTQLDEGIERCNEATKLGAHMTTIVRLTTREEAQIVSGRVPGWKMFPDVRAVNGQPAITLEECHELGFPFVTTHFTLKAAMDGMLEHGRENVKNGNVVYTWDKKGATGLHGFSATPLWEPKRWVKLESKFTGAKEVLIGVFHRDFRG
jgi:methylisocitrate lyase